MIIFPKDNTEYEANALGAWCGTRTRGVFSSDNHYVVSANGDMTVTVSPGLGWLKMDTYWGVNAFEINPTVLTIDTADGQLTRYAAICLQVDKNLNDGGLVVKYGPYGTNPTMDSMPLPEQDSLDYDEIYVAIIKIRAGATSILPTDIDNSVKLNEAYCGIMRDGVTGIPTQQLYDMWLEWFTQLQDDTQAVFANYQGMANDLYIQYQAEIATHEGNALAAYNAYVARMTNYEATAQADFEAWVETIKGILDEETAGHLQLEIEELQTRFPKSVLGTVSTKDATPVKTPICALYSTSWAFGIGGFGVGPFGGSSAVALEAGYEYDNDGNVTVTAPTDFAAYTVINRLSDTMYAFMKDDANEMQSLVLRIVKEG